MELFSRISVKHARPHSPGNLGRSERTRQENGGVRDGAPVSLHRPSLPGRRGAHSFATCCPGRPRSVQGDLGRLDGSGARGGSDHRQTKKRASAGESAGESIERDSPETVVERLRALWAFGTSIDGLGLSPGRFWLLTHSEYSALKHVHDDRVNREYRLGAIERC